MSDGGFTAAARPLERDTGAMDDAFAAGEGAQRVRDADYLDAFATRLIKGPRKREKWETPVSPVQHDPDFARDAATLITGLAQSIRAGIADSVEAGHG